MGLIEQVTGVFHLPARTRRIWSTPGRAHIELREVPHEETPSFCAQLEDALTNHPAVTWAQVLTSTGRVLVAHTSEVTTAELVDLVEAVEADTGADRFPFGVDRPDHPADHEPVVRAAVALAADATGIALALTGRLRRWRPVPIEVDTAALLAVVDNVPALRGPLDRHLTHPVAELALSVGNGVLSGLTQGALGPMVDVAHRLALVTEAEARRRTWVQREAELCTKPTPHPTRSLRPTERPAPLGPGPVERHADRAWIASLGGFGVALAATRSLDRAAAALLAGIPKPARLGREVFAAQLGRALADRGVLVVDPEVLRRLDRIGHVLIADTVLFPDGAAGPPDERALAVLRAGRAAGLKVTVAVGDGNVPDGLDVDAAIPGGALLDRTLELQATGSGVAVVATDAEPALEQADCSVGLVSASGPPWGAHLVASDDVGDAWLVLEAIGRARQVSEQSATLALFSAGAGAFLAFGGLVPGTTRRVTTATNLATVLAMANGVRAAREIGGLRLPPPRDLIPWHALDPEAALARLGSTWDGLGEKRATARQRTPEAARPAPVVLARNVGDELLNPLTPVLAIGAGLSLAVGSITDAVLVGGVVGFNALIGGVQRFQTDRAVEALNRRDDRPVRVRRGSHVLTLHPQELVPGDVIHLEAGDAVPADCRLLAAHAIQVDESSLTGESLPVDKSPDAVDTPLVAERSSMLYEGTSIAAGVATALVVAVGPDTEAERGVALAGDGPPPSGVEVRLSELTTRFLPLSVGAGLGVLGAGLLRGRPLVETAGAGVSLAVAAVPEGLPLLATVAQLGAARRLSRRGALVRNPRAIEALGRVDVLCADKTGTLTEGRLRVAVVSDGDDTVNLDQLGATQRHVLDIAARATPIAEDDRRAPHPTDRAIHHALDAIGRHRLGDDADWVRLAELPFEPGRSWHLTLGTCADELVLSVKGAPEAVLDRSSAHRDTGGDQPLDDVTRARLTDQVEHLAGQGLRVLAVAERTGLAAPESSDPADGPAPPTDDDVRDLTFVGFLGLRDPVRPSAAAAVAGARKAGVSAIMITGDHPATARGVAEEIGLGGGAVLTGADIDEVDDAALGEWLGRTSVCARVTPAHKVRIVQVLQRAGRVVAMTGDGSNDAPAIRLAHVGIALGTRATPAAREAADLTVLDDRIETIVDAIGEGRAMWASVRDAVSVLAGGNLGEILFTLGGSVVSGAPPLNARQLLLVNLLTDVAPALAIAVRPPADHDIATLLREGPDRSLGSALDDAIAVRALTTAGGTALAWGAARLTGTVRRASTVALVALVGSQLGQTLATGGSSPPVLAAGLGSAALMAGIIQTPGLSNLMGCRPLGPVGWSIGLGAAATATAASVLVPRVVGDLPDWLTAITRMGGATPAGDRPAVVPAS